MTGGGGNVGGVVVAVVPVPPGSLVEGGLFGGGVNRPAGTGVTATLITRPRKASGPLGCVPPTTIDAGSDVVTAGTVVVLG